MTRKGRVLAVKWGLNPNSSSLGVDVTFFLFGAAALALLTPVLGALVRWRAPASDPRLSAIGPEAGSSTGPDVAPPVSEEADEDEAAASPPQAD